VARVVYADLPQPAWWGGNVCDSVTNPGSYPLGGSYNGQLACGPGSNQGGGYLIVHFYNNAFGVGEWECVELSKRYLYLAYGVAPYQANGGEMVDNYSGDDLVKVANDGSRLPSPGDIFSSYDGVGDYWGHTGVIMSVNISNGNGTITILEQNHALPSNGVRTVSVANGILGSGIVGWLHNPVDSAGLNDIFQATGLSEYGWRVSYNGTSAWQSLLASTTTKDSLVVGDFDNDGKDDDVLQASGVSGIGWRVSMNGNTAWQTINGSTTTKSTLMVGDFNQDGHMDDVMQATGLSAYGWRVSIGGNTAWQSLKASTTTMGSLLLGDFDSDGYVDDVMQASGISGIGWRVSYNGTSAWQPFNTSMTITKDSLMVGDFDNDGDLDDIFYTSGVYGTGWKVSLNGTGAWQSLKDSTATQSTLLLGDFDSDGYVDDVFQATGLSEYGWRVSYNGTSAWQPLKASMTTLGSLMVGDF